MYLLDLWRGQTSSLRGDDRSARAVAAAPRQAAIGRGSRANPPARHRSHPRNWPAVEIMVRGDSHFATPEVMDLLEEKRCGYIFGLTHQHALDRDRAPLQRGLTAMGIRPDVGMGSASAGT
jgi:Transposase DDE domain group 1